MFRSNKVSVLEWMLLFIILAIPIVNVIFLVWLFLARSSKTIRNFFIAGLVFYLLAIIGLFDGVYANIAGLFS